MGGDRQHRFGVGAHDQALAADFGRHPPHAQTIRLAELLDVVDDSSLAAGRGVDGDQAGEEGGRFLELRRCGLRGHLSPSG